jgi:hypothetical protein
MRPLFLNDRPGEGYVIDSTVVVFLLPFCVSPVVRGTRGDKQCLQYAAD